MKIADASGRTLDLPRPPAICSACLRDAGCWHIEQGIELTLIAVYCEHNRTAASYDAARRSWEIWTPAERRDFVVLVATAVAAMRLAERRSAPGARH